MATIKLGALITDIAGSVGGTTFRRGSNFTSVYNKQRSQIKSASSFYTQKNRISNIFRKWSILDGEQWLQWDANALLYPIVDKFGTTKYLTGRQLYTKLNTQLLPTGQSSNVGSFVTYLETAEISVNEFNINTSLLALLWGGSFEDQWLIVQMYQVRKYGNAKPYLKTRTTYYELVNANGYINIWDSFRPQFPFAQPGDTFGFNFYWLNSSGIKSAVQSVTATMGNY